MGPIVLVYAIAEVWEFVEVEVWLVGLEKHGPPIGRAYRIWGRGLADVDLSIDVTTLTPIPLQRPTMTTLAAHSPSGFAMIANMFSETFETPTYSPNGGVQLI